MNLNEARARFGLAAEYYLKFINMPEEDLRVLIANLMRDLGRPDIKKPSKAEIEAGAEAFAAFDKI